MSGGSSTIDVASLRKSVTNPGATTCWTYGGRLLSLLWPGERHRGRANAQHRKVHGVLAFHDRFRDGRQNRIVAARDCTVPVAAGTVRESGGCIEIVHGCIGRGVNRFRQRYIRRLAGSPCRPTGLGRTEEGRTVAVIVEGNNEQMHVFIRALPPHASAARSSGVVALGGQGVL